MMDFFHVEKVGFSLGGRVALRGLGCCCSAGLALTVGFVYERCSQARTSPIWWSLSARGHQAHQAQSLRRLRLIRRTPLSAMHPPTKRIRTKNDSLLHHYPSRPRRLLPPRLPVFLVLPTTERTALLFDLYQTGKCSPRGNERKFSCKR